MASSGFSTHDTNSGEQSLTRLAHAGICPLVLSVDDVDQMLDPIADSTRDSREGGSQTHRYGSCRSGQARVKSLGGGDGGDGQVDDAVGVVVGQWAVAE